MTATIGIQLSPLANKRDLGGIPIDGGVLRAGLALRTDDLSIITEQCARGLVADGLTAVIDLRTPEEVAITGRGPLADFPVAYHHIPLIASIGDSMSQDTMVIEHETMGQMYVGMVENAAPQLVTALNVIAYAPGTTAFHCAAGRDRTGVLAAALLLILGAEDDDIIADYARTGPNMDAIIARTRPITGAIMSRLGFDLDALDALTIEDSPMDIAMRSTLDVLRERHGEALAPLRAAGLSADTIARLRERALTA
ncbi:tyrosine-protein phosphatase [Tomitella biformata]|uniref:tyrosine-protein phosphatase n=1 Tax=Tomitella biformata TaxID=630403 RepID=UPI000466A980|nr:tyrosine-protein phosphatase [Tomitella biformata]